MCVRRSEGQGRQRSIICGDLLAIRAGQLAGDRPHDEMLAPTIGIVVELALEIARVETGEARRVAAVAFALRPVAGEAGGLRPAIAAAERDYLASGTEAAFGMRRSAGRKENQQGKESDTHIRGNRSCAARFP